MMLRAALRRLVRCNVQGMQRNPGCASIEDELERALVKAGAIPEHLAGSFVGVRGHV